MIALRIVMSSRDQSSAVKYHSPREPTTWTDLSPQVGELYVSVSQPNERSYTCVIHIAITTRSTSGLSGGPSS